MSAAFVAALIQGFERTLDDVRYRLPEGELRRKVDALQKDLRQARRAFQTRPAVTTKP